MEQKGIVIIQKGTVEMEEGNIGFDDKHPEIKNITCSIRKLAETGLPLYIRMLTGKNAEISNLRRLILNEHGIYAEPGYPEPFTVGDEYIIFTKT